MTDTEKYDVYITKDDYDRVLQQINFCYCFMPTDSLTLDSVMQFEKILARATVVSNEDINDDTVTVNSRIMLTDPETGAESFFTLALPAPADADKTILSIFSSIGGTLLGRRKGDAVECIIADEFKKYVIADIDNTVQKTGA